MHKGDLISAVSEKSEVTKKETEKILNNFFDVVGDVLCDGDKITITGFGTFEKE